MEDKEKIGIFGGAFNPVHNGHMNLASTFVNSLGLDKLIFIPTAVPPHKTSQHLAPKQDRINMLNLAIENNSKYEISTIEFDRQGKSYTYDTLNEIKRIYPNSQLYLIIGADQFLSFDCWYKYKEILDMVVLCTSARENEQEKQKLLSFANELEGLDLDKFYISTAPVLKISSSQIRNMINNLEDCSSLLPEKVYNYIIEKGIYIV